MKYKPYPKYKDSGIEWLGKIPEEWKLRRLKTVIDDHKNGYWGDEEYGDENDIYCIRVADFDYNNLSVSTDNLTIRNIQENWKKKLMIKKGDLLIEKSGGGEKQPVGRVVYFNKNIEAICSNFIERLKISKESDSGFLKYIFAWLYSIRINIRSIKQTTGIQNLDIYSYLNELIVVPPKKEQIKIANYLDKKTEKIDTVIKKNKRQIELLKEKRQAIISQAVTKGLNPKAKMRDSGVDWLGKIPEKWDMKKLKYVSDTRVSNVNKKSEDKITVKLCNYLDVYGNEAVDEKIEFMIATATDSQISKFELKKGDVIITKDSETPDDIGIPAFVDLDSTELIVCGYHLALMTPRSNVLLGKYLFRLIQSNCFKDYFEISSNGVTRFGLDSSSILNMMILLPSIKEQKAIADFLDRKVCIVDNLVQKIQLQNQKLQEFRQSLISNVVTGKIKV